MRTNTLFLTTCGLCAVLLGGCYMPPRVAHAQLELSAAGGLALDGRPVSMQQLQARVAAERAHAPSLIVEVTAAPQVGIRTIQMAVAAIEGAHARVAFAGATSAE